MNVQNLNKKLKIRQDIQDEHDINPVNQKSLSQPEGDYMESSELTEKIIGYAYRVYNSPDLPVRFS